MKIRSKCRGRWRSQWVRVAEPTCLGKWDSLCWRVRNARAMSRRCSRPDPAAVGDGNAPQAYQQLRGPPPHRHVGPAGRAERVLQPDRHTALHNGSRRGEVRAHRRPSQGVQPQEGRQIRTGEGGPRHVEVSRDGCTAVPIIERPRLVPDITTHPPHLRISIGS